MMFRRGDIPVNVIALMVNAEGSIFERLPSERYRSPRLVLTRKFSKFTILVVKQIHANGELVFNQYLIVINGRAHGIPTIHLKSK